MSPKIQSLLSNIDRQPATEITLVDVDENMIIIVVGHSVALAEEKIKTLRFLHAKKRALVVYQSIEAGIDNV